MVEHVFNVFYLLFPEDKFQVLVKVVEITRRNCHIVTCCLHHPCFSCSGSWLICPIRRPCLTLRWPLSTSCHPPQVTLPRINNRYCCKGKWLRLRWSRLFVNLETYTRCFDWFDYFSSPSSGLFTLILAAIFPSNSSDRFTLSKLLAVALR